MPCQGKLHYSLFLIKYLNGNLFNVCRRNIWFVQMCVRSANLSLPPCWDFRTLQESVFLGNTFHLPLVFGDFPRSRLCSAIVVPSCKEGLTVLLFAIVKAKKSVVFQSPTSPTKHLQLKFTKYKGTWGEKGCISPLNKPKRLSIR